MHSRPSTRLATGSGALAVLALGLAACGGNGSSSAAASGASTPAAAPSASQSGGGSAAGRSVTAVETDFKIALSPGTLTAGTYTFTVQNKGQSTHALEVEGPGLSDAKSAFLSPGQTTQMTVTLQQGKYEIYCPVGNHKDMGMQLEVSVS